MIYKISKQKQKIIDLKKELQELKDRHEELLDLNLKIKYKQEER